MRTQIKVCGITRLEDALASCRLGVHALGFNFFSGSPRFIEADAAAAIARRLPPFIYRVGIFVNEPRREMILRTVREVGLQAIQFHGDERPGDCDGWEPLKIFKALRLGRTESMPEDLDSYRVDAFLVDACQPGSYGGTGRLADWDQAIRLAQRYPIILSGGLNAGNVGDAVRRVSPPAVDVCSGVESSPGMKDPDKIRDFVAAICRADEETGG